MLRLACEVKQYAWGQAGGASLVAALAKANDPSRPVRAEEPYAELWMGAHPSGSSRIAKTGESLLSWLEHCPGALGQAVLANFGRELPFLFKVLSIKKALSIQAHPDKMLAAQLHARRPDVYRDPHHKPELALAVNNFEALCGFCQLLDISDALCRHPELARCVGSRAARELVAAAGAGAAEQRRVLKAAFTALMTCSAELYQPASEELFARLSGMGERQQRLDKDALFCDVFQQFPRDVGTLAVFFLNHVCLKPGEAIYLAANEPHAYLSGELVEAMASSDNVIRAGLTQKLRDTEVLCECLTYTSGPPHTLKPKRVRDSMYCYQPPFEEFQVLAVQVEHAGTVSIPAQRSPMVLLCLQSSGIHCLQSRGCPIRDPALDSSATVRRGSVLFVPAGTPLELHSAPNEAGACQMLAYTATANDCMFVSAQDAAHNMCRSVSDSSLYRHSVGAIPTAQTSIPTSLARSESSENVVVSAFVAPRATS